MRTASTPVRRATALIAVALVTTSAGTAVEAPARASGAPRGRWDHVVIVVEENHGYGEIIGNPDARYINRLARRGALFTRSRALTHPSQPNYLALFSGSMHHIENNTCPITLHADNLGHQLRAAGYRFAGYAEGLPYAGDPVCDHYAYRRRHVPWASFADLPGSVNRPLRRMPTKFRRMPTVSFVIPDLDHDMHDGTVAQADRWLRAHVAGYANWARRHRSLLIVTWDEGSGDNRIPTIAVGAGVRRGRAHQRVTHYNLLRTLEDAYHLRPLGNAASARGIARLGG
jgi:hypothetical protein